MCRNELSLLRVQIDSRWLRFLSVSPLPCLYQFHSWVRAPRCLKTKIVCFSLCQRHFSLLTQYKYSHFCSSFVHHMNFLQKKRKTQQNVTASKRERGKNCRKTSWHFNEIISIVFIVFHSTLNFRASRIGAIAIVFVEEFFLRFLSSLFCTTKACNWRPKRRRTDDIVDIDTNTRKDE